jgi:hypothetical protein
MNNYPQITIADAGKELDRLHGEIENKMRSTVSDAIRAGEILSVVKASLGHGEFLPWIKSNCSFSERTAQNYMRLFSYKSKCENVADLQEAYKQVESLESQAKQSEAQKANKRVSQYIKTGIKPEGWRRGTDDELYRKEIEYQEQSKKRQEQFKERENAESQKKKERQQDYEKFKQETNFLNDVASKVIKDFEKKKEFKQRIKLSQSGESDLFIDALMDYLEELTDDNRRIEACNNIVKVCRNISIELQRLK